MFSLFIILISSRFNLLEINGKPASEFAGKGRPVFLRMVITGCPFAPPSVAQWEQAAKLFPQVDFVTYDCWKDNGQGVCDQFLEEPSSPYHVLIQPEKLAAYPNGFGNPPDISVSPQRFIDTIIQNTDLYPLAPPIFSLFPQITDSFISSSKHPIILIYDSTNKTHSNFASAWSKAANEELYPEDDSFSFGLLDSSKYPKECMRWTQSNTLESPIALIYSRETGQFLKIQSYFSVVSDVRRSIMDLNLITTNKKLPDPVNNEENSIPTPTPIPQDYTVITNDELENRPLDLIKETYTNTFNFNGPSYTGEPANDKTCTQVNPSQEDHQAALKVLNFLRNLAGLSDNVVENSEWSKDCQDTALIIHKIGTVPSNHVIMPELIPKTCTRGSEFIQTAVKTAALSNLASNDGSCYQSVYRFILDEGENNRYVAGHRRSLLKPNLEKIGMGFYPLVNEPTESANVFRQKPAVTVLRSIDGQAKNTEELPSNIKFVSWPSAGPFPINQLPSTWTISYSGFNEKNLANIDELNIYITRDDGTPIPFTAKLSQDIETKDTLSLYLDPNALELCQDMRTITVRVINDKQKYSLQYSFLLFGNKNQVDICLYATDASKCPSNIPSDHQFSQNDFASSSIATSVLTGTDNVLVYVAEEVNIGADVVKLTAPRLFFKNKNIAGTFEIGVSSIVSVQDPTGTNFIIDWDPTTQVIGYLSTSKSPLSVLVIQVARNEDIDYQNLPFYNGANTNIAFNETIVHFREKDVFNSFNYMNNEYYVCSYALKSIAEFSIGYDKYIGAPNSILVQSNKDMENQHTYRKKVKIYTSEQDLNTSLFMAGVKKDYIITAPTIGQAYYLYCMSGIEDRINSLTIEPDPDPYYEKYSSIKLFDLASVSDVRNRCSIPNVNINGVPASGFLDTNYKSFNFIQGDPIAYGYYTNGIKRYYVLRPEPTTHNNFPNKHVLNIVFDYKQNGAPKSQKFNPIIYTPGNYSEYVIIQPDIPIDDSYAYDTYEFRPAPGTESIPVMLTFYTQDINSQWHFAPQYYNDFQGIWFIGYKNITIHFNSNPLNRVDGKYVPFDALNKFHFDTCESVTFIGTEDIPVPDPENTPPPQVINGPIEIKNDQPTFSFNNGNPYQVIQPESVVISATTVFEAHNIETKKVEVQPQTYSIIKEMKITESINVDSGSITLNKCNVNDEISISMKKNLNWPQITLVDTTINPKEINIDVGQSQTESARLLENEIIDQQPHVVVDGIKAGQCEGINEKIKLQNNLNYKHYCLNDNQIIVSQLDQSNFEPPVVEPPNEDQSSSTGDEGEKPTEDDNIVSTEDDIASTEDDIASTEDDIASNEDVIISTEDTSVSNDPNANPTTEKKGLSTGAIVGIVIGCVCGVALIVGLAVFFVIRHNKGSKVSENSSNSKVASAESIQI